MIRNIPIKAYNLPSNDIKPQIEGESCIMKSEKPKNDIEFIGNFILSLVENIPSVEMWLENYIK